MEQVNTVKNCNYAFAGVKGFEYAGVSLDKLQNPSSFTLDDTITILSALRDKKAKLTFNALVDIENPNSSKASLEKLDWQLFLDDAQILSGLNNDAIKIEPNQTTQATIKASLDPAQIANTTTLENLWTLYKKLSGKDASGSSVLSLKLKPTVGGYTPKDYFTVKKTF